MIIRVIDVETTGFDPTVHRIVEIATVDLIVHDDGADEHGPRYRVEGGARWSSLVNPGRPIPPESFAVHHITDDTVRDAPPIGELLDTIKAGPPAYYCAHNRRFDMGFIQPAGIDWLCTYKLALWLWADCPSHSNQCLRYWLGLKFPHDPGPPHRAPGDAYVTAAILWRVLRASGLTLQNMLDVSNDPALLPRLRFGEHKGKPIAEVPTDYLEWCWRNILDDEDVQWTVAYELRRRASRAAQGS
jgi:exodeoxyribonuclease X